MIAEQRARRAEEERARRVRKNMWLTHHWPEEYDRCAQVRGRHLCRRCLILYPLALTVMGLALAGVHPWPESSDVWIIWGLCIPATLEFLAEKLLGVTYSARRQVVVTALVAVALGRGLAYEIDDRWSWNFWGPVFVFGGIWFAAAVYRAQQTMMQQALEASLRDGDLSNPDTDV